MNTQSMSSAIVSIRADRERSGNADQWLELLFQFVDRGSAPVAHAFGKVFFLEAASPWSGYRSNSKNNVLL